MIADSVSLITRRATATLRDMKNDPATTDELAKELGITPSYLRVIIGRKGPVPGAVKRGGVNLYDRSQFVAWWESMN